MWRIVVAATLAALVPACTSRATTVFVEDPVVDTIDQGHRTGANIGKHAFDELSKDDYETLVGKAAGILAALNDAEIDEHAASTARLEETVRIYGVQYLPSEAQAQIVAEGQSARSRLRMAAPEDFDFTYADLQVRMHAGAQLILDQVAALVGPGAMGDYVIASRVRTDEELARASALLATFY